MNAAVIQRLTLSCNRGQGRVDCGFCPRTEMGWTVMRIPLMKYRSAGFCELLAGRGLALLLAPVLFAPVLFAPVLFAPVAVGGESAVGPSFPRIANVYGTALTKHGARFHGDERTLKEVARYDLLVGVEPPFQADKLLPEEQAAYFERGQPRLQRMRFGLATTLMGNGYYSFDLHARWRGQELIDSVASAIVKDDKWRNLETHGLQHEVGSNGTLTLTGNRRHGQQVLEFTQTIRRPTSSTLILAVHIDESTSEIRSCLANG